EQLSAADIFHAGIGLQRMQMETREVRLSITGTEADDALKRLRASADDAAKYLNAAERRTAQAENRERLKKLVALSNDYIAAVTELTAAQKEYLDIAPHLQRAGKIGGEIEKLIEQATASAVALAAHGKSAAAAQMTQANRIGMGIGFFVVVILIGSALFGFL